jgi:hypothetical protein
MLSSRCRALRAHRRDRHPRYRRQHRQRTDRVDGVDQVLGTNLVAIDTWQPRGIRLIWDGHLTHPGTRPNEVRAPFRHWRVAQR